MPPRPLSPMAFASAPRTPGASPRAPRAIGSSLVVGLALSLACSSPPPLPPEERARESIERAEAAMIFEGVDEAERGFREALAWSPGDLQAVHGLWRVALARDDIEAALGWLDRIETEDPRYLLEQARREHCGTLARAVEHFLMAGDSRRALTAAARLQRSDCRHPEAASLRAEALMAEAGRVGAGPNALRAVAFYQEAIEADPSRVDAFLGAGEALLEAGRSDEALSLLSDALVRHPDHPGIQSLMLRVLSTPRPQ